MNAFFLKYILWLPPLNPLNTYRLALLFLLALPATKVAARACACKPLAAHACAGCLPACLQPVQSVRRKVQAFSAFSLSLLVPLCS